MKIAIGADHGGFALKQKVIALLKRKRHTVVDYGTYSSESVDYPCYAAQVARAVAQKKVARGILICKTGIGNSIVANKVKGVRAALCYNEQAACLSRQHNDANVLVLGARFTGFTKAQKIISIWLVAKFEGGRHRRRIKQIERIERNVSV